jgi:hypothetical protein
VNDDTEVQDRFALIEALESAGCKIKGSTATCPWHDDATPSAQIKAPNGHWRITCFKCDRFGDVHDIRALIAGRPVEDILKAKNKDTMPIAATQRKPVEDNPLILADKKEVVAYCQRAGQVRSWYIYGQKSAPTLIVARIEQNNGSKKTFRQFTPTEGGYAAKNTNEPGTLPLYRQDEVASLDTVLVVEGEKACEAAWQMGIPAVTSAMGSKNASWSDWSALAGKKVIIWPDNDKPGAEYADEVSVILKDHGCTIGRLDPSIMEMPVGGDIADLLERWGGNPSTDEIDAVKTFIADAEVGGAAAALAAWQAEVMAGKWQTLDMPQPVLGAMTRAMMPGAITLLCADPGAGKSWFTLQCMRFWNNNGHKTAVRMLEDDIRMHTSRILAQITGNDHSNDRWVLNNPMVVAEDMLLHSPEIDRLGALITAESDDELPSHKDLIAWVEKKAKAGCRVVMLDPITAIKQGKEPWLQDFEVVMRLKSIAKKYGMSIVVCTHPRGTAKEPSLTGMAGGNAWPRFCHTALWLSQTPLTDIALHDESVVRSDRIIHILKCRYGQGNKQKVAAIFDDNCTIKELGMVMPKKKQKDEPEASVSRNQAPRLRSKPNAGEDLFDTPSH